MKKKSKKRMNKILQRQYNLFVELLKEALNDGEEVYANYLNQTTHYELRNQSDGEFFKTGYRLALDHVAVGLSFVAMSAAVETEMDEGGEDDVG